jgi:outer membrane protein OmpA-like peptidoglycan-associated protein
MNTKMMLKYLVGFSFLFFGVLNIYGQTITVEAYTFESGNRGFLNQVHVSVQDPKSNEIIADSYSNPEGIAILELPKDRNLKLIAAKDLFHSTELDINTSKPKSGEKIYIKIEMKRAPGYLFEITLAEKRESSDIPVNAIKGALIEVYNNTTKEEVLNLPNHSDPEFQVTLLKNNHYTILIRKKGYLAKRMEAFVNVKGCILCFEGVGNVEPGVADNLSEGNEIGTLLANVEMEPLFRGKKIELQNIYYDYNKFEIREDAKQELDKVIQFMIDNPHLTVELGAHTDSRGKKSFNMNLSKNRANAAVNYLSYKGNLRKQRITSKGYGETQLLNHCEDGVECSEEEHAKNRRTELKILGIEQFDIKKSLVEMKKDVDMEKLIEELTNQEVVKIKEGENIPDEIKKSLDAKTDPAEQVNTLPENIENEAAEEKVESSTDIIEEKITEENEEVPTEINEEELFENIEESNTMDGYTGFKVALVATKDELTRAHKLFKQFDDVIIYKDKGYNYYLIGNFQRRLKAMEYINTTIRTEYPKATLLGFQNGNRID